MFTISCISIRYNLQQGQQIQQQKKFLGIKKKMITLLSHDINYLLNELVPHNYLLVCTFLEKLVIWVIHFSSFYIFCSLSSMEYLRVPQDWHPKEPFKVWGLSYRFILVVVRVNPDLEQWRYALFPFLVPYHLSFFLLFMEHIMRTVIEPHSPKGEIANFYPLMKT